MLETSKQGRKSPAQACARGVRGQLCRSVPRPPASIQHMARPTWVSCLSLELGDPTPRLTQGLCVRVEGVPGVQPGTEVPGAGGEKQMFTEGHGGAWQPAQDTLRGLHGTPCGRGREPAQGAGPRASRERYTSPCTPGTRVSHPFSSREAMWAPVCHVALWVKLLGSHTAPFSETMCPAGSPCCLARVLLGPESWERQLIGATCPSLQRGSLGEHGAHVREDSAAGCRQGVPGAHGPRAWSPSAAGG